MGARVDLSRVELAGEHTLFLSLMKGRLGLLLLSKPLQGQIQIGYGGLGGLSPPMQKLALLG